MGTVKYTGPVASFHCPTNAEIRSLKVHFSPKQEGSGDPSPENVRPISGWDGVETYKCGKNIGKVRGYSASSLSNNNNTRYLTNNYGTVLNTVDYNLPDTSLVITQNQAPETTKSSYKNGYVCIVLDNLVFGETYKISFKITNIISNPLNAVLTSLRGMSPSGNSVVPQVIDDNIVCFTLPLKEGRNSGYKAFELRICGMSFTMSEFMVTTVDVEDRTFEPYHGSTTNYEFGVLGKNKFDKNTVTDYCRINGSGEIVAQSGMSISDYISVVPGRQYTITTTGDISGNKRHAYYDEDKQYLRVLSDNPTTITIPEDACYIRLTLYNDALDTTQLELGSTATAYEPYNPNKTVYGGWVDLISGEVQQEWEQRILNGSETWSTQSPNTSFNRRFLTSFASDGIQTLNVFVNWIRPISTGNDAGMFIDGNLCCRLGWADRQFYILNAVEYLDEVVDIASLKEYLSNHNLQVVYPLAIPNTYHLAPTALQTFLGQNNVWSNADYVEVEYDLHETQTILERKAFILANQPHIVKPAATPLQNFVIDVPAPLKECKVYFNPIQEGEGDPSPENVRAISGWTGVEVTRCGKNLFDGVLRVGRDTTGNGTLDGSNTWRTSNIIKVKSNTYYQVSYNNGSGWAPYFNLYDGSMNRITVRTGNSKVLTTAETQYITLQIPRSTFETNAPTTLLEEGQTITSYEPYSGITIPIDWSDSAGTVYSGYVDLVKGEVVKEAIKVTPNDIVSFHDITDRGNGVYEICLNLPIYARSDRRTEAKCSCFLYGSTSTGIADRFDLTYVLNQKARQIRVSHHFEEVPTIDAYREYLQSIGFEVVYYVDQERYAIDPITLKTLRGTNNIWSNANGNIDVKYWTH